MTLLQTDVRASAAIVREGTPTFLSCRTQSAWPILLALVCCALPAAAGAADGSAIATVRVEGSPARYATGAEVAVNGKTIGPLPLSLSLQPGRYLIEVSKEGSDPWRKWLDVAAGQSLRLVAELRRRGGAVGSPAKGGTVIVTSDVLEAVVYLDGRPAGQVPAIVSELKPGSHVVEVRAGGRKQRREITLRAGQSLKLRIRLAPTSQPTASGTVPPPAELPAPRTGKLRVDSAVVGARVYVDGEPVGETPLSAHEAHAGPHVVTVRHPGHKEFMATVEVKPGQTALLEAKLARLPQSSARVVPPALTVGLRPRAAPRRDVLSMGSYAAHLIDPLFITADVSTGFPHLLEVRATTGLFDLGQLGMDVGVDLGTYGAVTDVGVRLRLRVLERGPWALAVNTSIGGGGGPKSRGTFYWRMAAVGSVLIGSRVSLSVRTVTEVYSDRHCPQSSSTNELPVCANPPTDLTAVEMRERFAGLRLLFASMLEVPITSWLNLFGVLEIAPFQGNRRAYTDAFADIMPKSDPGLYGRIGVTFKY